MNFYLILISTAVICSSCVDKAESTNVCHVKQSQSTLNIETKTEGSYDAELAKKVGADEYGMRPYVMAFLKEGPNRSTDKDEAAKLQAAHMANISRLAEEGSLIVAGPFYDNPGDDLRGIYIFNVSTIEKARALTETDPAIQAGSLVMDLKMWYGSAALMLTNDLHQKVQKTQW